MLPLDMTVVLPAGEIEHFSHIDWPLAVCERVTILQALVFLLVVL